MSGDTEADPGGDPFAESLAPRVAAGTDLLLVKAFGELDTFQRWFQKRPTLPWVGGTSMEEMKIFRKRARRGCLCRICAILDFGLRILDWFSATIRNLKSLAKGK